MNAAAGQPTALASRTRRSIVDAATSGLGMARGPHISIRGNRFRLINGAGAEYLVPTAHLDVVVVDASDKTSKLFFENEYDPNSDAPPTCFSDNGTGPSSQAMMPQAPTCAVCHWNSVGSDVSKVSGRGIKACSDRKKIAVVIPDDAAINVYELQVPPGSLTNMKAYGTWLKEQTIGNRRMDLADVVTRLEFDPEKMGTLKFAATSLADDERTMQLIDHIDANRLADQAVGRNDVAADPANVQNHSRNGQGAALPAPAGVAPAPQPTGFQLPPPTTVASAVVAAPAGPTPAPPPRTRGRRGQQAELPAPTATPAAAAPFMAPAAQPAPQFVAPAQPQGAAPAMPAPEMPAIPDFLQRAPAPAAPPLANGPGPAAPAPRFGVGTPPAPPPAVAAAMGLPTRR